MFRESRVCVKSWELTRNTETPGRKIVRHIGESLVQAMEMALRPGNQMLRKLWLLNV